MSRNNRADFRDFAICKKWGSGKGNSRNRGSGTPFPLLIIKDNLGTSPHCSWAMKYINLLIAIAIFAVAHSVSSDGCKTPLGDRVDPFRHAGFFLMLFRNSLWPTCSLLFLCHTPRKETSLATLLISPPILTVSLWTALIPPDAWPLLWTFSTLLMLCTLKRAAIWPVCSRSGIWSVEYSVVAEMDVLGTASIGAVASAFKPAHKGIAKLCLNAFTSGCPQGFKVAVGCMWVTDWCGRSWKRSISPTRLSSTDLSVLYGFLDVCDRIGLHAGGGCEGCWRAQGACPGCWLW